MKRFQIALLSCIALAGSAWLAHVVWGQPAETKEKTVTITKSEFERLVAERVAAALAEHKDKPVTDEQILRPENWHKAIYEKAEYVIYTGPGQFLFHHWPPAPKSGGATAPLAPAK
jgi:hypothetical protein